MDQENPTDVYCHSLFPLSEAIFFLLSLLLGLCVSSQVHGVPGLTCCHHTSIHSVSFAGTEISLQEHPLLTVSIYNPLSRARQGIDNGPRPSIRASSPPASQRFILANFRQLHHNARRGSRINFVGRGGKVYYTPLHGAMQCSAATRIERLCDRMSAELYDLLIAAARTITVLA